ncbi:MAG: hypothetical protein CVU84_14680 [Firmicutes bacterium HGW-Firmicutes-1]|jgi:cell wall-associated NlpC family hydrolase|nr:MAG: hypothetical protein CVU84_14680 [Firmicutes bacterium HGW-Firmicutes-1]
MRNKKLNRILTMTLSATLMIGLFSSNINMVHASLSADKVSIELEIGNDNEKNNLISYKADSEGNISGPEDFTMENNDIYILDSTDNKVIKSTNNQVSNIINLHKKAIKIASNNNNLYTLNNDFSITKYDELGNDSTIELDKNIVDEAIVDFQAIDNYLYITTTEGNSGKTYKINLDADNEGIYKSSESFEGRIFDKNTIYRNELIPEEGNSIGHSCEMTIQDIQTGSEFSILLTSKHWVMGAQYLGIDEKGNYRIKLIEMETKKDYTTEVEETIRTINPNGQLVGIKAEVKQKKSIPNQTKVFENEMYGINNLEKSVQIAKVTSPNESSLEQFKSKLDNDTEILDENQDSELLIENTATTAVSTISRSTIMSSAKTYHTSFAWTCSSSNLAAMTSWIKPRYVGSAGSYSCMPYCWGGFASRNQFITAMNNSGRVGNINCPYTGYVSNTYGLDCSGFVSRAWGLTTKYSTRSITDVTTNINTSALQQGDALNLSGKHIVLFEKLDSSGNYVLYEATQMNSYDRVAHTIRSATSLSTYTPIKYNYVY